MQRNLIFLLLTVITIATIIGTILLFINLNFAGGIFVLFGGIALLIGIGELEKKK